MIGEGSTYTVGSIIDRLYVQYLTPPDAQHAQARLAGNVATPQQDSLLLSGFTIPEDEALMRQGSLLEIDQELIRVVDWNSETLTVLVERGEYGTPAGTYTLPILASLNPPYPRVAVFEAVSDNIMTLYPRLFTVRTLNLAPSGYKVYALPDESAVAVQRIWADEYMDESMELHGEIVDYHPEAGGRALLTNYPIGTVWLKYTRRMLKATSEDDTLEDIGMDERWVNIVMAGAAADLLAGRDITAVHAEWLKNTLEAENIRVGTRTSIAGALRQYRNMLLEDAAKEMRAEYRRRVRMRKTRVIT